MSIFPKDFPVCGGGEAVAVMGRREREKGGGGGRELCHVAERDCARPRDRADG